MAQGTKMFTVDRFLGLNEAVDGNTEQLMGEASHMVNWTITDGYNLATRPGAQRIDFTGERDAGKVLAMWAGFIVDKEYLVIVDFKSGKDRIWMYEATEAGGYSIAYRQESALGLTTDDGAMVKIFPFGGKVWIMSNKKTVAWENGSFAEQTPYVPLVIVGAKPAGGGTTLENINLLSPQRRITYSADGTSTEYLLPEEATSIRKVVINNEVKTDIGNFSAATHKLTFKEAPAEGVGNVEITYNTNAEAAEAERLKIVRMPLAENYNGSTDTRLFVAGDGTNICYYTGLPESGEVTALYFPAMNEVAVDMSDSPITALSRHYGKLLVFKPDGTYTITYEPVTLTDGKTIAGFYLRAANREFGCDALGQVQTVDNYPRTLTKGGIYEWKITSSYYQDERYAKRVSDKVQRTLQKADISRAVTCDDTENKTYYVFLNDSEGTVLVSRYALAREDIWCVYKSKRFRNVKKAATFGGRLVFSDEEEIFYLDDNFATDAPDQRGEEPLIIEAEWQSGFMDFGANFLKKYSSQIYVNLFPQSASEMTITAQTDRRTEYAEKFVGANVFSWPNMSFPSWSFEVSETPKSRRIRLKVKKFVYYRLIFRSGKDGGRATVLGYDQQVRFGSMTK